jgi:hypothetical protein
MDCHPFGRHTPRRKQVNLNITPPCSVQRSGHVVNQHINPDFAIEPQHWGSGGGFNGYSWGH